MVMKCLLQKVLNKIPEIVEQGAFSAKLKKKKLAQKFVNLEATLLRAKSCAGFQNEKANYVYSRQFSMNNLVWLTYLRHLF